MKYLRACAICRNYFPPTNWLCGLCWKAMERQYLYSEGIYRVEKNLPHLKLLDWHEDNHRLIRPFVNSLKQGGPNFLFKRLGLEMFSRFIQWNLWDKRESPLFIPAPSSEEGGSDHASQLAETLAFYFGGDVKSVLVRGKNQDFQKSKSRRKRASIQIHRRKSVPKNRPLIFVDDVLTTGSTARRAFKALNQPKNFFVFTLIWKRPPEKNKYRILSSYDLRDEKASVQE